MKYYMKPDFNNWDGRIDSLDDYTAFRWHQVIKKINLNKAKLKTKYENKFGILGFCCDEGVKRNKGRAGAKKAPDHIRKQLANLPVYFDKNTGIFDCGNFYCKDQKLLQSQKELGRGVYNILSNNMFPIVLGGGHETTFGNFLGIKKFISKKNNKKIGIINFDAHFDLRPYKTRGNSGTMFSQIFDVTKQEKINLSYMCLGIQISGNTKKLFQKADDLKVNYLYAKDINRESLIKTFDKVDEFISNKDYIYITICSDVFSSAFAPGVSSPQPFGMDPELLITIFKHILKFRDKVISFDISEVSPRFDSDNRTAKLAAIIIFALINNLS